MLNCLAMVRRTELLKPWIVIVADKSLDLAVLDARRAKFLLRHACLTVALTILGNTTQSI